MNLRRVALERIEQLLNMARDSPFGKRYVELAKRISTRTRVRIPRERKMWLCKCNAYLVPGRNAIVRIKEGKRIVICEECGRKKVIPFK